MQLAVAPPAVQLAACLATTARQSVLKAVRTALRMRHAENDLNNKMVKNAAVVKGSTALANALHAITRAERLQAVLAKTRPAHLGSLESLASLANTVTIAALTAKVVTALRISLHAQMPT